MKIKIVVNSVRTYGEDGSVSLDSIRTQKSFIEVWSGEMDILDDREYLTKISIIAEGVEHPICDVPFAVGVGYWQWVGPDGNESPAPLMGYMGDTSMDDLT